MQSLPKGFKISQDKLYLYSYGVLQIIKLLNTHLSHLSFTITLSGRWAIDFSFIDEEIEAFIEVNSLPRVRQLGSRRSEGL